MSIGFLKVFIKNVKLFLDCIKHFLYNQREVIKMTVPQKIKMALAYKNMSEAELARALGTSPQAFNQRMKTGRFSSEDMEKIATAIGAEYFFGFEFEDGYKI